MFNFIRVAEKKLSVLTAINDGLCKLSFTVWVKEKGLDRPVCSRFFSASHCLVPLI